MKQTDVENGIIRRYTVESCFDYADTMDLGNLQVALITCMIAAHFRASRGVIGYI